MKRKQNLIKMMLIVFIIMMILPQICFAIDTATYSQIYQTPAGTDTFMEKGGKILGIVQAVGTAISVIALLIIGIIYITASPEKKGELKQRLILFAVGALLFFAASNIMSIVANFGKDFNQ